MSVAATQLTSTSQIDTQEMHIRQELDTVRWVRSRRLQGVVLPHRAFHAEGWNTRVEPSLICSVGIEGT